MNRTDRLLAIVLELQASGGRRAQDLAATFETSKRTIYRDVQALCEAGVPIVALPGQGYALSEGYFLPPLRFTTDEATMLLLGCDVMAQHFDAEYRAAADAAGRKIAAVLPPDRRAAVGDLQTSIRFIGEARVSPAEQERLQRVRRAMLQRRRLRFGYHGRQRAADGPTQRDVDPYGLAHVAGVWYLVAFDHDRQAMRQFRLDRMEQVALLPHTFERPPDFRMQPPDDDRQLVVRALFDREVARWVREAQSFYTVDEQETADGLLVTLRVRHARDVLPWLLSWGRHARVIEPPSLRQALADEIAAMLASLSADPT